VLAAYAAADPEGGWSPDWAEVWQLIKRLLTRQAEIITIVRITFLLVCPDHITLRTW
jgi:hypothetical protein